MRVPKGGKKMASRTNQKTFFVTDDIAEPLEQFHKRYPYAKFSAVVNAALREYLRMAQYGVDGNLQPLVDKQDQQVNG